jgi:hypothetical protein
MMPPGDPITPYDGNSFYWKFRNQPCLLLGASAKNNLFQCATTAHPCGLDLTEHLDHLAEVGGNFLRCSLSVREKGDVQPFIKNKKTGLYALNSFAAEYFDRLQEFCQETARRGFVVQIEVWDAWDFIAQNHAWEQSPWNPVNNKNFTAEDIGLDPDSGNSNLLTGHPFFRSVPALDDLQPLRSLQKKFLDRVLNQTLSFDNILYVIGNEADVDVHWVDYWGRYIRKKAAEKDKTVCLTDLSLSAYEGSPSAQRILEASSTSAKKDAAEKVFSALKNPRLYQFLDISNYNLESGQEQYATALNLREVLLQQGTPKPIHCCKIYGAEGAHGEPASKLGGSQQDALQRLWRNFFAGVAGLIFHRPPEGLGLSSTAKIHLRAMRRLSEELALYISEPRPDLINPVDHTEAYCFGNPAASLAICIIGSGSAEIDCECMDCSARLRRFDILRSDWIKDTPVMARGIIHLQAPNNQINIWHVTAED